jgi:hypothetical protein
MKAFPTPQYREEKFNGMDLRDYFAGQIVAGLLARPMEELSQGRTTKYEVESYIAYISYEMADAMMKARDK